MRILLVHNAYQHSGGEDAAVAAESMLLTERGHDVIPYRRTNDSLKTINTLGHVIAGVQSVWSSKSYREIRTLIDHERPNVAHVHNTFPLISPAVYYACSDAGVPVVQTLHNYRLLCPAATFVRRGKVCEACLGRLVAWPGIARGCYRESHLATATVAAVASVHRAINTWQTKVSVYVALSEFARRKFIEGGLPPDSFVVKPNFVASEFVQKAQPGEYALFVGRLSEEKGPQLLEVAWRIMGTRIPIRIVGDGPLLPTIGNAVRDLAAREFEMMGWCRPEEVRQLMRGARFLVAPSICYENFPVSIAEAFACGLPVIASRLGSMEEIVQDGVTGLHFEPGNAADLAAKVEWAWHHPEEMAAMGKAARAEYEAKYTPKENYEMLMKIYRRATGRDYTAAGSRSEERANGTAVN